MCLSQNFVVCFRRGSSTCRRAKGDGDSGAGLAVVADVADVLVLLKAEDVLRPTDRRGPHDGRQPHADPQRDLHRDQQAAPLLQPRSFDRKELAKCHQVMQILSCVLEIRLHLNFLHYSCFQAQLDPEQSLYQGAEAADRGQGRLLEARVWRGVPDLSAIGSELQPSSEIHEPGSGEIEESS